jgi:hypothetical protein
MGDSAKVGMAKEHAQRISTAKQGWHSLENRNDRELGFALNMLSQVLRSVYTYFVQGVHELALVTSISLRLTCTGNGGS